MKWVDGLFVCIKDDVLLCEENGGKIRATTMGDDKAIIQAVQKYFPVIDTKDIGNALTFMHANQYGAENPKL